MDAKRFDALTRGLNRRSVLRLSALALVPALRRKETEASGICVPETGSPRFGLHTVQKNWCHGKNNLYGACWEGWFYYIATVFGVSSVSYTNPNGGKACPTRWKVPGGFWAQTDGDVVTGPTTLHDRHGICHITFARIN